MNGNGAEPETMVDDVDAPTEDDLEMDEAIEDDGAEEFPFLPFPFPFPGGGRRPSATRHSQLRFARRTVNTDGGLPIDKRWELTFPANRSMLPIV